MLKSLPLFNQFLVISAHGAWISGCPWDLMSQFCVSDVFQVNSNNKPYGIQCIALWPNIIQVHMELKAQFAYYNPKSVSGTSFVWGKSVDYNDWHLVGFLIDTILLALTLLLSCVLASSQYLNNIVSWPGFVFLNHWLFWMTISRKCCCFDTLIQWNGNQSAQNGELVYFDVHLSGQCIHSNMQIVYTRWIRQWVACRGLLESEIQLTWHWFQLNALTHCQPWLVTTLFLQRRTD